jgi:uncharacterized protein YndB with AHSA1/START domain
VTDTLDAPADMRVMGIVHRALRRDLGRARELLAVEAAVTTGQRVALGEHLVWLMSLLHEHHQGEDRGLWPRVRANNPLAGPLLDAMDHDHHALAPGMAAVEQAAQDFRRGGPARPVLDALDRLEGTLLPHLQREEDQMMPVVSATLTQREWAEYDHEQNTQGRSSIRLGMLGHWLIDGLTPAQAQLVTGLVPPVQRFVLVRAIGPLYRRQARRRWGARPSGFGVDRGRRFPLVTNGAVRVEVAASPSQVWTVLADPSRVGEWSHEAVGARWLDGADEAVPGARFEGRRRPCLITTVEADRRIVWRTRGGVGHDSTQWSFTLEPLPRGTRITQSFQVLTCARWYAALISLAVPAHKDCALSLTKDLVALGELAATAAAQPRVTTPRES